MKKFVIFMLCVCVLNASLAEAKTMRASEMTTEQWSQIGHVDDLTIEFRFGDEIPVTTSAQGDLLETIQTGVSLLRVKRGFFLRLQQSDFQISWDGTHYQSLRTVLNGSFSASTGQSGVPVNAMNLIFEAHLKDLAK